MGPLSFRTEPFSPNGHDSMFVICLMIGNVTDSTEKIISCENSEKSIERK